RQPTPEMMAKLGSCVRELGPLLNPGDVTAAVFKKTDLVGLALEAILNDPNIDCVAMINASLQGELGAKGAQQIVAGAVRSNKPVFLCWSAREAAPAEAYAM